MSMKTTDDDMSRFQGVLASLRIYRVPQLLASIRKSLQASADQDVCTTEFLAISVEACKVVLPSLFGSYHLVYVLELGEELRLNLEVPATGYPNRFDDGATQALGSEALTMRLIQQKTSIPVPKVYHFDTSFDNELKCPYILMEYIGGFSCFNRWFDKSCEAQLLEDRHKRILEELAKGMLQLDQFSYELAGAPLYDQSGQPAGMGPIRKEDTEALLKRLEQDDPDTSPVLQEFGPFSDPAAFFLCMLNHRDTPTEPYGRGIYMVLRLFIEWTPFEPPSGAPKFVLSHPDFNLQNIIVSEDGALAGIIDWDGVAAVPYCIGNIRYPSWLTRDWDTMKYGFGRESAHGSLPEDSP